MSFNIRYNSAKDEGPRAWDRRREACVRMVGHIQPDVIGMQEARTPQRDDLRRMLPGYVFLEVPATGGREGGNTTLCYRGERFEQLDWGYFFLSETPGRPSPSWNASTPQWRTSVWVHLRDVVSGKKFFFLSTHLPHKFSEVDHAARLNGARLNVSRMKTLAGDGVPVFIVGDMNCSFAEEDPRREALVPYFEWLREGRAVASEQDVPSFHDFRGLDAPRDATHNFDHIFYRNAVPVQFETITDGYGNEFVSDHYPILLTVDL